MKTTAAAFVLALASVFASAALAQDVTAPPSAEQIRKAFREAVEVCAQSVRSGKHFEDMPEALGKIEKMSVIRQVAAAGQQQTSEPSPYDYWRVPNIDHLEIFQEWNLCTVTWIAKPFWLAQEAMDLSGEREPAITHATALLPNAAELPFYETEGVAGRRFMANDGDRSIPFYVALWQSGNLSVAINAVPQPTRVLQAPLNGFETRCLRPLYGGRKLELYPFELERADNGLQASSGFVFYGNPRFGRVGVDPADPKACAFHEPSLKLADTQRLISAEQWGISLSAAAASTGGVIVVARAH